MASVILFLLIFGIIHCTTGNLINKLNLPCEPAPVPEYIPDHEYGSYCRFNASYSQIDVGFIIDVSGNLDPPNIIRLQEIFSTHLKLQNARYGNDSNNLAFVAVSETSHVMAPFGSLNSWNDVNKQFQSIFNWTIKYESDNLNFTDAMVTMEGLFDKNNNRGKLVILVTNILNPFSYLTTSDPVAERMKKNGVKIFSIAYSPLSENDNINNTFLSALSTPGWYTILKLNSTIDDNLYKKYVNFIRQASCVCLSNTIQFSVLLPSENDLIGPVVAEYYSDCIYNVNGTFDNDSYVFDDAELNCQYNFSVNARLVALNSTLKAEFIKSLVETDGDPMMYWTGLNGSFWNAYNGTILPVTYVPDINDTSIQAICQQEFQIKNGSGGVLIPYNENEYILCSAAQSKTNKFVSLCEQKAVDSFDNPRLCKGPYINADVRPHQIGNQCSNNLYTLWLDIILVVDVSKHNSIAELNDASTALMASFNRMNMDPSSNHSIRLSLITYGSLPKLQFQFGDITNASPLEKHLNLSRYRNPLDSGRNAKSAFLLAQSLLLTKKSYRRPTVVFVSSGFKSSENPSSIVNLLKRLYNTAVITISTTPNTSAIDQLSTYGFNMELNDEVDGTLEKAITQANCFCPSKFIQFIHEDSATKKVTYFSECFFGSSVQKTVNEAFDICGKQQATPVIVTHQSKAEFLIKNVIPAEINMSPIFSLGLKRHFDNVNVHFWHEFQQDGYSMGDYPPKLLPFSDPNLNCTAAFAIDKTTIAAIPVSCNDYRIPYICQLQAFDGNHLN